MFLSDTKVGLSPDDQLILHAAREAPALFDRPSTVWKQPFTTASQHSITVPLLFNFYHSCSDPPIIPEPKPKPKPTIQPAPGGHALSLCRMHAYVLSSRLGLHILPPMQHSKRPFWPPIARPAGHPAVCREFATSGEAEAGRAGSASSLARMPRASRGGMQQQEHLRGVSLPCRDALAWPPS